MEALGLGYMDYNGAKILLRVLTSRGIAKEAGRISLTGKGRKQVVYEIPEEITLSVKHTGNTPSHDQSRGACTPKRKSKIKVAEILKEVLESKIDGLKETPPASEPVGVSSIEVSEASYEWDDGWEED